MDTLCVTLLNKQYSTLSLKVRDHIMSMVELIVDILSVQFLLDLQIKRVYLIVLNAAHRVRVYNKRIIKRLPSELENEQY